ncbi:hypothetical protein GCM10007301_02860 [Azorhizobium oxalatiphilum]|uniref:Lipoprotein n=1 Tax=Azorhizobium oxalatiphilum TaxID=980631 RepID=A0A917BKN8_9HYPH|nr:hypothetical protein [Azorhizobium oxalatiphilum]GGF46842.1 hypothetical protein GCM10007301_02860 [Azorhizobium oxalatiphilum]
MRMMMRLSLVAALGLMVSGCDRCGDFFWQKTDTPKTCSAGPKAE